MKNKTPTAENAEDAEKDMNFKHDTGQFRKSYARVGALRVLRVISAESLNQET